MATAMAVLFDQTREPPRTLRETLAALGPGIVLASCIVGSGELIAATTVGAAAGFLVVGGWMVWQQAVHVLGAA